MRHVNPTFSFSERERNDIIKAWVLTSIVFAVFFVRTGMIKVDSMIQVFLIALLTAGVGVIVHELCHKYAAHRFGVHGEFYANTKSLYMSILFAFLGFIFLAPGAVHIMGRVTRKENGIISAAGPASNMILAPLFSMLIPFSGFIGIVGVFGMWINAFLGAFNMIPFMNLDGAKILAWNKVVYFFMVAIALMEVMFIWA